MTAHRAWIGILSIALTECAVKLTPAGAMVREIGLEARNVCEFLGIVEADDRGVRIARATIAGLEGAAAGLEGRPSRPLTRRSRGDSPANMRRIRNAVAELGGDVFIVAGADDFEIQAEAYRCSPRAPGSRWEVVPRQ